MIKSNALALSAAAVLLLAACVVVTPEEAGAPEASDGAALDFSSGRPVVMATINGEGPFPLIFDTGAGGAVVTQDVANQLQAPIIGQAGVQSGLGGDPIEVDLASLARVALAGVEVADLPAVVLREDMLQVPGAVGVIGPRQFPDQVFEIDVTGRRLRASPSPRADVLAWHDLDERGLLSADLVIGDVTIPAHIDTGNPGVITLPQRYAEQLRLTEPLRDVGGMRTIDSTRTVSLGRVDADASFAGATLHLGAVNFADMPSANIGVGGLAGFIIVIDNPNQRWGLAGASSVPLEARPPSGRFGARMAPERDGTLRVVGVDAGSRAEASGVREGDRIVALNGAPIADMGPDARRAAFSAAGVRLTIERDGAEIEIVAP